jgi:hypothetical protein
MSSCSSWALCRESDYCLPAISNDIAKARNECLERFMRLLSLFNDLLRSWRSSCSNTGFNPVARQMASRSSADPNVVLYFLFCGRAQVEVYPRICSSRLYGDGGPYFTGCCNA